MDKTPPADTSPPPAIETETKAFPASETAKSDTSPTPASKIEPTKTPTSETAKSDTSPPPAIETETKAFPASETAKSDTSPTPASKIEPTKTPTSETAKSDTSPPPASETDTLPPSSSRIWVPKKFQGILCKDTKKNKAQIQYVLSPSPIISNRDIAFCIFSKLPRKFYPAVECASKALRNVISSQEFSLFKKVEGRMEVFTIVVLTIHLYGTTHLYALRETLLDTYTLIPHSYPPIKPASWFSSMVGVGSDVIALGGSQNRVIRVFSATGIEETCEMQEEFGLPAIGVIGKNLYAIGVSRETRSYKCQSFDLNKREWHAVSVAAPFEVTNQRMCKMKGLVLNDKLYINRDGMVSLVFDPNDGTLVMAESLDIHWTEASCVIRNKLYSWSFVDRKIHVYDEKTSEWSILSGVEVEGLSEAKLIGHGNNLRIISRSGKQIWGREYMIRLEGTEVVGEMLWSQVVLDMDHSFFYLQDVLWITL